MPSLLHHLFLGFLPSPEYRRRRTSVSGFRFSGEGADAGSRGEGRRRTRGRVNDEFLPEKDHFPSGNDFISSPSNPFVKHCVKLRQSSSYRRSCGLALVVGSTPIREIASREDYGSSLIDLLFLLDDPVAISSTSAALVGGKGGSSERIRTVRVSSTVMKKLSGLQSTDSTEAVAVMKIPRSFRDLGGMATYEVDYSSCFSSPPRRILVLDGIQDPGNVGTLLRSAMSFKWDGVFLLPRCCDPFNEKALRAARGASFHLPIISGDWVNLEALKNRFRMKMLAAHPEDIHGEARGKPSLSLSRKFADSLAASPLCLVLGSEGQGLSQEAMDGSDLVNIPMAGGFESLNVSVAGGIFMFTLQIDKAEILGPFP